MAAGSRAILTPEGFLDRVASIKTHKKGGDRAPHKPLMLLLALGRVASGSQSRLIPYETADEIFKELWDDFGRPSNSPRAQYPFGRLRNDDGLWEIPEESQLSTGPAEDILVSEAKRFRITGGFRRDVHELLMRDSGLVSRAAHQILSEHFPPTLHHDILEAVRIESGSPPWEPVLRRDARLRQYTPRDSRFRRQVLEAYDKQCAVCEYDIRFGDRVLGLEAAHIQWHSHHGGDVVPNGLALCVVHHKALDSGALGLDAKDGGGYEILISGKVQGRSRDAVRLRQLHKRPIRPPRSASNGPSLTSVEWHRKEVFHP